MSERILLYTVKEFVVIKICFTFCCFHAKIFAKEWGFKLQKPTKPIKYAKIY